MSDRTFRGAADLLARRIGLRIDSAMKLRLSRCIQEAADARDQPVEEYVAVLARDPAAVQELVDRAAFHQPEFFANPNQFEALATEILPSIQGPVTLWSAGCGTGFELYSIAMVLAESEHEDWRVIGTDVATGVVTRARAGRFSDGELRGLSLAHRARFLERTDDGWQVVPEILERVEVLRHNLVSDEPPVSPGECQIVFARNVLSYIERDDVTTFLRRLARWMHPEGYLFLGDAESLWHVTDAFALQRVGSGFVYRLAPMVAPAGALGDDGEEVSGVDLIGRGIRARSPMAVADLRAAGEAAVVAGDYQAAADAFRTLLGRDRNQPTAHLHLGLALEAVGEYSGARRSFAAARSCLERVDLAPVEAALEGFRLDEMVSLLETKLRGPGEVPRTLPVGRRTPQQRPVPRDA
ncbi:MAG TPA: CheR family methyltransferase [Egibacteraceae bacterium]|nr:CheR family methyltransferase [Egibacteraceae bacterium]